MPIVPFIFLKSKEEYEEALYRLKFDEFFIAQVRLGLTKIKPP